MNKDEVFSALVTIVCMVFAVMEGEVWLGIFSGFAAGLVLGTWFTRRLTEAFRREIDNVREEIDAVVSKYNTPRT